MSVRDGGVKLGGGFQKTFSGINLEVSGGLNINAVNSQNIRPIGAFRSVSPYARFALGLAL